MFYLGIFVIVAAVFGVLTLTADGVTPVLLNQLQYSPLFDGVLVFFILGIGFWLYKTSVRAYKVTLLGTALQIFGVMGLAGIFAIKSLVYFNAFNEPKQLVKSGILVEATVTVDELSDSQYSTIDDTGYRQKAYLSNIRPATTPNSHNTISNPFDLPDLPQKAANLPDTMTVLLTAYPSERSSDFTSLNTLTAGKSATMTLRLSLPTKSDVGFDNYHYLLGRHIHAQAQVIDVANITDSKSSVLVNIQKLRGRYRQAFFENNAGSQNQAQAVAISLLTGDRAFLSPETKQLYQWAGISHLLAISGSHVLFLAMMLAGFVVFLTNRFLPSVYHYLPRWQLKAFVMVSVAFIYALFVGADFPAMRTVYFLLTAVLVRQLLIRADIQKVLCVVGLGMVYFDPFALWQASFWLSFVASSLLISFGMDSTRTPSAWQFVKLQAYLFFAMLPIGVAFFGKVSAIGMLVNLLAVGLFGFMIVPLELLAGVIYGVLPSVSLAIWGVSVQILSSFHALIGWLQLSVGNSWIGFFVPTAVIVLGFLTIGLKKLAWLDNRVLVIPLMLLAFAVMGVKNTKLAIINLPSSQGVYQTLIFDDDNAWLVLSYHNKKPLNYERAFDELFALLKQHNIGKLSGIVIQNDADNLGLMSGLISLEMPVNVLWSAGTPKRFGTTTAQKCTMGKLWKSDGFELAAMTGFDINDSDMHTCQLVLTTHKPAIININDRQTAFEAGRIVINTKSDDKLWQVWQLLCPSDDKLTQAGWVIFYGGREALPFAIKQSAEFNH